jgi:hypothetical protein
MNRVVAGVVFVLAGTALCVGDESSITGVRWQNGLQAIARQYKKGPTQIQNDLNRQKLIEEITELDEVTIQLSAKVREVRWNNGIAEVYTESFLPNKSPKAPQPPMSIYRSLPIELKIDQATAAEILPGMLLKFRGPLVFQKGKYGAFGRTLGEQQMFTIRHRDLTSLPIGTYTSPGCEITFGRSSYPSRWRTELDVQP